MYKVAHLFYVAEELGKPSVRSNIEYSSTTSPNITENLCPDIDLQIDPQDRVEIVHMNGIKREGCRQDAKSPEEMRH